ncbi:MAG: hypothetical protein KBF88_11285, partial [Polyangiaceae bacterium]|nr:hypothetical protein [Polyangiaceae bacterium]
MKEQSANQTSSAIDEMNTREEFARALRSVVVLVRKHWPFLVASVLVAGIVSILYSKSQTRIYQAQATIEIDPNVNSPLNGDKSNANAALGLDYFDNREYFETQLRLVTTSKVLETAATNAGLLGDYKFFGYTSPPSTPPRLEAAVDRLRGMVSVETVRNTRHALIRVDDRDNARAAVLANAVANAFIEHNLQRAINSTSDAVVWLSSQVDSVKNDLEVNENSLHDFKKANNLPSISINETSNMIRQELTDYNTSLTRVREKRKELEARYGELSKVLADDPEHLPASELLSNQFLSTLRTEYISTKKIQKSLMDEGRGENHPSVKAAAGKLANAREALVAEIANIKNAVKRDLAIVTA